MDKILLRFVSLFNPLLEKTGVDTVQLHNILKVKLMMDNRRPKATFSSRKANASKTTTNSTWANILLLIMGCVIGSVLFLFRMPMVGQTIYFFIFMVLMALTLISDFTTVLIDTRDQFIILPRPVNDRTVAMSRFMHITLYIIRVALLEGLPGIIMAGFIDGWMAVPIFFIQVVEATLLSVLLVNLVYFVMMKSVSPQRFKDIISYFQIGFSITIFAVYYLVPRLVNISVLQHIDIFSYQWVYILPPVWIAGINEVLLHHGRASLLITLIAALGIAFPFAGIWFVAKVLAPGFNRQLTTIATADGTPDSAKTTNKVYKTNFRDRIADLIAPDPVENAGFRITWKLAARTREFKMKVFPAFAYVPIYFLYFALNGQGESVAEKYERLQSRSSYIFLIYMTTFVLSSILQNISQSSKYKSAWVYFALPIDKPGKLLSGMYKAIITLYFLPYFLTISIAVVIIWGPETINDIILAFCISTIYGMLMALFMLKGLPFSRPVIVKAGGKMIISFVILGFIALIGLGHVFLIKWEKTIWIAIIPALLINWIMFSQYKKQSWDDIEMADM